MSYSSIFFNVSTYPILFQNYVNSNLETVATQLQTLGLNVTEAQTASRIIERTPEPTASPAPSSIPTGAPSSSYSPSAAPTVAPTATPESRTGMGLNPFVIIFLSLLLAASIVGTGTYFFYCRKRKKAQDGEFQDNAMQKNQLEIGGMSRHEGGGWQDSINDAENYHNIGVDSESPEANLMYGSVRQYPSSNALNQELSAMGGDVVVPTESFVSNHSLVSAGRSMVGDSGDEADTTQIYADEFDQYKDQNLELMRKDIEDNLEDGVGMMNQAVARALMDYDNEEEGVDLEGNLINYIWGCPEGSSGPEIEAGALCSVVDWLKHNESASAEEK